jgi:hypothetical protein
MALDFTALQAELFARGFDYLNDGGAGLTRAKRWINEAMHEVDELEQWEYLFANAGGAAPLTIADLDRVDTVYNTTASTVLRPISRTTLVAIYGPLSTAGTAAYWYKTTATTIGVYPNGTPTLSVNYWKFGPDLSAGTDAPLMPDRFRQVIVEKAVAKAYRDTDDRGAEADALAEAQRLIDEMRLALLPVLTPAVAPAAKEK